MKKDNAEQESKSCAVKRVCGKEYCCSVELTLQVIGGKWKPVILYHLGRRGTLRFGQVRKSMPSITQKMLTQQLRELEADGMVHREVHAQVPPKVEYSLTELGLSVMPVLKELCRWGGQYEKLLKEREAAEQAA
ncbi:MAG TPA: helix-turn-helix domain-containing protein [Desulfovibrio sp.]|jgi:DNA-binding HxlR family transcriptional regulator|uniref:winged helix-turn-helix transcriptional regulator n=1 Tax=Desulfovibrio TaxID=872 RepID=UPI002A485395|nr:helix-turn-helix domain-containing protein [Desulfovibrio sp.]MDY0305728.1 helix-turn-helix domain-containing protein [Desulfovibrionaceae bacterium]HMM37321.1 helix-turn-helix domain-containing protein [Desulfovibrio sp.]